MGRMTLSETSRRTPSLEEIIEIPKVVLHDHLDGGLRPETIIELAAQIGYTLPSTDVEGLRTWFVEAADSGSLPRYLETFDHTIAVMQTAEALERVARESVLDLAADGVVYAEQRWAPEQHLREGLSLQDAVEAVGRGLEAGEQEAAAAGRPIVTRQLVTAMRHADRSDEIAALTIANRGKHRVIGFDIAGAELGFPASNHASAFDALHRAYVPATVHAGEADGVSSIADALHAGRALRLGHGVRVIEDMTGVEDVMAKRSKADLRDVGLGPVAAWVRDRRVTMELCPSSNVQTGGATSVRDHPITLLKNLGFAVTVNTDNRLMSGTSMSREMHLLVTEADWSLDDLLAVTLTAAWAAFIPLDERQEVVENLIVPRTTAIREERQNA
ncbi:adenosine deaminase 2 [Flavimobilis marinus]|uniref:adenosine deaminase n=2 Tax=Flavimobilis marinus TaxID=285351 RepID=A0A1I2DQP1_9MICO|nr:adenosine deaminase 2 [Flavimobilis marinus]SFE82797.1 adenosine deaminase [Flavimobilis marinus]